MKFMLTKNLHTNIHISFIHHSKKKLVITQVSFNRLDRLWQEERKREKEGRKEEWKKGRKRKKETERERKRDRKKESKRKKENKETNKVNVTGEHHLKRS
jgi:hypothetical protein